MQLERLIEFIGNHWELVLLFIGILAWLGYDIMLGNKGNIDPLDAVTMINRQDALVIDVRSTADFSKGHIVHAKNIPG
ncbi:membrane protein, partial [Achromatium sp. WMS3]